MKQKRILIAEDAREVAALLELALQHAGYKVLIARDGVQALKLFELEHPDAILLDFNLPFLPGWDVCNIVKSLSTTPVLIMSGNAIGDGTALRRAPAADAYFSKPFDITQLLEQLELIFGEPSSYTGISAS